jgi:hypothetical protein
MSSTRVSNSKRELISTAGLAVVDSVASFPIALRDGDLQQPIFDDIEDFAGHFDLLVASFRADPSEHWTTGMLNIVVSSKKV